MSELMFGAEVALADGVSRLAGIHLADDSDNATYLVLRHGGMLGGVARARADALHVAGGNRLSLDYPWAALNAFDEDSHGHDPRLMLDSTKIRFVGVGSLSQREGEVVGVIRGEDLAVESLVVSLEGSALIVPLDQAEFQSRRWVYVDAARYPVAVFKRRQ